MLFNRNRKRRKESPSRIEDHDERLRRSLVSVLGEESLQELEALVQQERAVPPKVAIIGKAGVGKTTTVNNLFNVTWKTSHTVAGTKSAQMEEFDLDGGGSLNVIDMPGLGEDIDADLQNEAIYQEILPSVDVVLWVIQANARDLAEDQRILSEVVLPIVGGRGSHLVIGLNQVDLIGPGHWNKRLNYPTEEQEESIERRCNDIASKLSKVTHISQERIVYYSALQRYHLFDLLIAIIKAADDLGWKFPVSPADPFELADPDVQTFVKAYRQNL